MIEIALVTLITAKASALAGKIKPPAGTFDEGVYPRLIYTRLPGDRTHTDDGVSTLVKGRFQLDIFSTSIVEASALERLICASSTAATPGLDGYAGEVDGTEIKRIYFPNLPTSSTAGLIRPGANVSITRMSIDLLVDFHE